MLNILVGMTGSVATILAPKIVESLKDIGDVKVIMTESATQFHRPWELHEEAEVDVFTDRHEWSFQPMNVVNGSRELSTRGPKRESSSFESASGWLVEPDDETHLLWKRDDPVLHIELREWADVLVLAPLSANTLAKMANGLCDNLLTCVVRAWDPRFPIVLAPAMNTLMWTHPVIGGHIDEVCNHVALHSMSLYRDDYPFRKNRLTDDSHFIKSRVEMIPPQAKRLACGDEGEGAMAHTDRIRERVVETFKWQHPVLDKMHGPGEPLTICPGIPHGHHPGAFAFHRRKDVHTGVDLYCAENTPVRAVEPGTVVDVRPFTGPQLGEGFDHWLDTDIILVEGPSGLVCYGEVKAAEDIESGKRVWRNQKLGNVMAVLPVDRIREDVPGHKNSMLHLELRPSNMTDWQKWDLSGDNPGYLDPTDKLLNAVDTPGPLPEWNGKLHKHTDGG